MVLVEFNVVLAELCKHRVFLLTFYVLGSWFRTVAVILVLDLFIFMGGVGGLRGGGVFFMFMNNKKEETEK